LTFRVYDVADASRGVVARQDAGRGGAALEWTTTRDRR
jgi:hypothetical protein